MSAQDDFLTDTQGRTIMCMKTIIATQYSPTDPIHVVFPNTEDHSLEYNHTLRYDPHSVNDNKIINSAIKIINNDLNFSMIIVSINNNPTLKTTN